MRFTDHDKGVRGPNTPQSARLPLECRCRVPVRHREVAPSGPRQVADRTILRPFARRQPSRLQFDFVGTRNGRAVVGLELSTMKERSPTKRLGGFPWHPIPVIRHSDYSNM